MEILKLKDVSFKANGREILTDVSINLDSGDCLLLKGGNGSGKSTLLKIVTNDIDRDNYKDCSLSGSVIYKDGKNVLSDDAARRKLSKVICYVPQEDVFIGTSVFEELYILLKTADNTIKKNAVIDTIKELKLEKYVASIDKSCTSLESVLKLNPEKLSGGQRKIVSILSGIIRSKYCEICIVDEPLNNLDINHVKDICNLLNYLNRELQKTIILVSHCHVFPCVTKMLTLENGKIVPNNEEYVCHNCFGKANKEGYYE